MSKNKTPQKQDLKLKGETFTITRVTLFDDKGNNVGHYITSGNVPLDRLQQMVTELIVQSARLEGAKQARTVVTKGTEVKPPESSKNVAKTKD